MVNATSEDESFHIIDDVEKKITQTKKAKRRTKRTDDNANMEFIESIVKKNREFRHEIKERDERILELIRETEKRETEVNKFSLYDDLRANREDVKLLNWMVGLCFLAAFITLFFAASKNWCFVALSTVMAAVSMACYLEIKKQHKLQKTWLEMIFADRTEKSNLAANSEYTTETSDRAVSEEIVDATSDSSNLLEKNDEVPEKMSIRSVTLKTDALQGVSLFTQFSCMIRSVQPGSQADLQGMRKGDEILYINGQEAKDIRVEKNERNVFEKIITESTTLVLRYNPEGLENRESAERLITMILVLILCLIAWFWSMKKY